MKNKLTEKRKKSIKKWNQANSYKKTVQFFNSRLPEEKYEEAKEKIKSMGLSMNQFYEKKIKEIIGDEENV